MLDMTGPIAGIFRGAGEAKKLPLIYIGQK